MPGCGRRQNLAAHRLVPAVPAQLARERAEQRKPKIGVVELTAGGQRLRPIGEDVTERGPQFTRSPFPS
jgi:hypothetical protein